ncbi:hypothetical protein LLH23_12070 [bacterium]|nr:hypothetical protein [bacterium]
MGIIFVLVPALLVLIYLGCSVYCLSGGRAGTHASAWAVGTAAGGVLGGLICLILLTRVWNLAGMTPGAPQWFALLFTVFGGALGGIGGTLAVSAVRGLRDGRVNRAAEDAEIAEVMHIIEEHKKP